MQYVIKTNNVCHTTPLNNLINLVEDITKRKMEGLRYDIRRDKYINHLITIIELALNDKTVDRDILLQKFQGELRFLQKYYKIVKK